MDQAIYELTVHEVGNTPDCQPVIRLDSPTFQVSIIGKRGPAMDALCRAFAQHLGDDATAEPVENLSLNDLQQDIHHHGSW